MELQNWGQAQLLALVPAIIFMINITLQIVKENENR